MIAIKKNIHPIPHDVDQINYLAFDYEQNTYRIDSYKRPRHYNANNTS